MPRLPTVRQRVKGARRDARRPGERAPQAAIAPTPAPTPAPAAFPVQAAAVQPAPHLISRRVHAAAPGTNQYSSLAAGGNAGAAALHTIPARPPLRTSRSPLGILPREPPYYGATKLRSLPSPPIFSTSFAPSLAPAYLLISLGCLPCSHPPLHLRPRVGGDKNPTNRKKGPTPPHRPLPLAPPTAGNQRRGS